MTNDVENAIFALVVTAIVYQCWNIAKRQERLKRMISDCQVVAAPPHVNSWIPFIGSAIEMGKSATIVDFIREKGNTLRSPIFTATILGKKSVFLADSRLLYPLVSRHGKVLDTDALSHHVFTKVMGCSDEEASFLFRPEVVKRAHGQAGRHLLDKAELEESVSKAQGIIDRELGQLLLQRASDGANWTRVDLFNLVEEHIFLSSVTAIVSPVLAERKYIPFFRSFNGGFPLAFANVPKMFLPKFAAAIEVFMERIRTKEFSDESSTLLKSRPLELGLPKELNDRANLGFLWASVANSSPAMFWVLYYILKDKRGAYQAIQREIDTVLDSVPSKKATELTTEHLDQMHCSTAVFQEVGRLQFGGFTVRDVKEDFVLETNLKEYQSRPKKYLIRKGSRIMAYAAVQHYDETIFPNPHEFRWDRFLGENGKEPKFFDRNGRRVASPTLQFGMGAKICPGRKFIEYEIKAYLALMLSRFEIRLSSTEEPLSAPGPEKLSHGISMNNPDRKVYVELRPRSLR